MTKKIATLGALIGLLLTQRPQAQAGLARIFFVDIGQGAGTLIVSPAGKTLLVDGGPGGGGVKIAALLNTLGIASIDFTVLTHYHIDHDAGLIELLNAGRVAGIAYDNGDGPDVQPPGTSTSSTSTRGTYLNYIAATGHSGVTRRTITPGEVIDLGGGMRATALAAGGRLLSGGAVPITNEDLNTESISLLIELNDFDFIVSGDLTGGGSTSTAKTLDVETFVGQLAGDVDVVQLNHHGSTTANSQLFLATVKAEVAVAQTGTTNNFGHPNRETVNKYLNTPATSGSSFGGPGVPAPGTGPVFYQPEDSPPADDRVSRQGLTGASAAAAGKGTILLQTDGTTTFSLTSFDDGGARLNPAAHTYPVDGASPGVTTDFPPTVMVETSRPAPFSSENVVVSATVNDRESPIASVILTYATNGVPQLPLAMTLAGGVYQATIPAQPDATRVDLTVAGSTGAQTTAFATGYFSGVTPIATIRATSPKGEPLFSGYAARIRGTVTAGSNTFSAGTNDDYVQDASGGINVFRSSTTPTLFSTTTPGQRVEVIGRISFNGGRQRLDITEASEKPTSPYGITVLASGTPPAPAAVTIAALNLDPESFEGQLVSIANARIVSGTVPAGPQLDAFLTIGDGTGTFTMKVDRDTDIPGFNPAPTFTVAGILQQDDFLRPFDTGYDIAPRGRPDLGGTPAGPSLITIAEAKVDAVNNADGTTADFVPDLLNQVVRVRGAVTSIDFRGGSGFEYYVQDPTGGIDLFSSTLNVGSFAVGDSVEAVGTLTQFNGLTEVAVSSISLLAPGAIAAAVPQVVTLSQLADGGVGEALEGRLLRVDNVTVASGSFPASGATGNVIIKDSTGSATLRIDGDTDLDGTPTPAGTFSVIGVLGQFDSTPPFDSGYQFFPRTLADIVVSSGSPIGAAPVSLDFGGIALNGAAFTVVTITNRTGAAITLTTPLTIAGTDADQFGAGAPGTTSIAPGASTTVSVSFRPTGTGTKTATLNIAGSNGSAQVALAGLGQAISGSIPPIVISELRFRGPNGANDEFVELYNNSDAPWSIGGYLLKGSNNAGTTSTRATIPAGTTLPARGHYLLVNGAAGAPVVPLADRTYGSGMTDDGGVAIMLPDGTTRVDQVGLSAGSAYKEGTPLASLGPANQNRGYERKTGGISGSRQDSGSNAADFQLLAPSDPQSLGSPPTPGISVAPISIGFGPIAVGTSVSGTLTVANLSPSASVTLGGFSISGPNSAAFSVDAPATITLAPGMAAAATVTFTPIAAGPHTATLTVTTPSSGSATIALTGTASAIVSANPRPSLSARMH